VPTTVASSAAMNEPVMTPTVIAQRRALDISKGIKPDLVISG